MAKSTDASSAIDDANRPGFLGATLADYRWLSLTIADYRWVLRRCSASVPRVRSSAIVCA